MNASQRSWKFPAGVAVALVFLGTSLAGAATYYVSQSTGSDDWNGQADKPQGAAGPWKTLARASAANVAPGDRILLKRGDTWDEELRPKGNGTPEAPITLSAYGEGNKPLIDRQDFKKDLFGIHLADQAGYKIVGIEFARCMTGIFNGRNIGAEFVAPIVSRTTRKVRLLVMQTSSGNPCITEFAAHNDTTGEVFNVARGGVPPAVTGK